MPNKVERLVRDALTSPVRVTVGEAGVANEDITQVTPSALTSSTNVTMDIFTLTILSGISEGARTLPSTTFQSPHIICLLHHGSQSQ